MSHNDTSSSNIGQHELRYDGIERRRVIEQIPVLFRAKVIRDLYCLVEVLTVFLTGIICAEFYVKQILEDMDYFDTYKWPIMILPLTTGILFQRAKLYEFGKLSNFLVYSRQAIGYLLGTFIIVALVGVILGTTDDYSRTWFGTWLILSTILVWLLRALAARIFSHWTEIGVIQKRVAIYGYGPTQAELVQNIRSTRNETWLAGTFGPDDKNRSNSIRPFDGNLDDLVSYGQNNPLDSIVIAVPADANDYLREAYEKLSTLPAEVKLFPNYGFSGIRFYGVSSLHESQLIDIQRKSISDWGYLIKLAEDYVVASIAAIVLSPLLLLVAVAIKIDSPGPVIFKQPRHGFNNKVFNVYKFRTMKASEENKAFSQALRNDARVTRIGRFLRRTSIDELPQIFNVLKGEMSIVGPRPHPINLNEKFAEILPMFYRRHRLKPGITGWAQINDFRGPTVKTDDMRKRLEADVYYIENWSLWLDLSIIAATPLVGIIHKNAV